MKERKKLYKASKLWVTATLVAFAGIVVTTTSASADDNTVVATPQTSQVNSSEPAPPTSTATPADEASATQNTLAQPDSTTVSYAAANTTSWETTTSTLNGPTKLPSNQVQNPRNYTIGVYRNETLIYTYHPQLGDLFITNQAGQVVNQPTTAGTYCLQLSQQGLSNMRRVPDFRGILCSPTSRPRFSFTSRTLLMPRTTSKIMGAWMAIQSARPLQLRRPSTLLVGTPAVLRH